MMVIVDQLVISILPLKFYEIKQFCIYVFYVNRNQFMYIKARYCCDGLEYTHITTR